MSGITHELIYGTLLANILILLGFLKTIRRTYTFLVIFIEQHEAMWDAHCEGSKSREQKKSRKRNLNLIKVIQKKELSNGNESD
jgi:hypothetical protein